MLRFFYTVMMQQIIKFLFLLFIIFNGKLHAQFVTENNEIGFARVGVNASALNNKYSGVEGSPYLYDDWRIGRLLNIAGKVLIAGELKFDQVDQVILVKGSKGEMFYFSGPVASVEIDNGTSEPPLLMAVFVERIKDAVKTNYFKVLNNGSVQLLNTVNKNIEESRNYQGVTSKQFQSRKRYFISIDKATPVEIKLDTKSILSYTERKKEAILAFMETKKLNLKNEIDIVALLNYYNTLK